jgi:type III secretion system low calcium response chaperone LcrH/SycD
MITEQPELSTTEQETINMFLDAIAGGATLKEIRGVPDSVMAGIYAHAYEFFQSGRLDDAEVFFRFLCIYDSYNPEYMMGMAATFQQKKQYQRAIDLYALMMVVAKNDYRPVLYTGQCYLFLKNSEQARENFTVIMESEAPESIKAQAKAYLRVMKPKVKIENNEANHVGT